MVILPCEIHVNKDLRVGCFYLVGEKLSSNLSRFVMFIWLLILLILITSYTATLTSLLTVEQFELASKGGIVGFHGGSFMGGLTVRNVHFEGHQKRAYYSYENYSHALSEEGDAHAIIDEIPYIKMFLSRYSGDYALVSSEPITSGFAFVSIPLSLLYVPIYIHS